MDTAGVAVIGGSGFHSFLDEARVDNPTLLDRDHTAGWLVLAALTSLLVVAALLRERRSSKGGGDGERPGRR